MTGREATDDYVATKIAEPLRPIATEALAILREGAPGATEAIKWGHPVLEQHGLVAMLRGAKACVTVGFALDIGTPDPHGLLEGESATMRHVKLAILDASERAALRDYIAIAAQAAKTR